MRFLCAFFMVVLLATLTVAGKKIFSLCFTSNNWNKLCWVEECSGNNEVYRACGSNCPPTCQKRGPRVCIDSCKPGCFCADGYLRDEKSGSCVDASSCS